MSITHFCLLNQTESKLLSRKLHDALRRWQLDWLRLSASPKIALVQTTAIEAASYRWIRGTTPHGLTVAIGMPRAANWSLAPVLITDVVEAAAEPAGDIARDVEAEVLRDLAQTVLGETGRVPAGDPIEWGDGREEHDTLDSARGFTAAECHIPGSHAALLVVLYPSTTAAFLAELPRTTRRGGDLVPARRAIESQRVRLDVVLGQTELLLPEVAMLAVGDVLRLDCNIAEPLQVVVSEGETLSGAHLGVVGDRKAIQLLSVRN